MYPIAVLIDELKNDDVALRLNSFKRLKTIARALGAERTRQELIPFLTESNDDEDEVLLQLAEELGGFTSLVGGPEHAHCLLIPLESLCTVEETVVRDRAVESIREVAVDLPKQSVTEFLIPLIRRLAGGEWFTSRVSACGLFAAADRLAPAPLQADLRTMFVQLCSDDTPMVRREAAKNVSRLAEVVEPEFVASDLVPAFEKLATDDQDSVRLLTVEPCSTLVQVLRTAGGGEGVVGCMQRLAGDKSWRVRLSVAQAVPKLVDALGTELTRSALAPSYVRLLQVRPPTWLPPGTCERGWG